jgi:hypothetical protein
MPKVQEHAIDELYRDGHRGRKAIVTTALQHRIKVRLRVNGGI